MAIFVDRTKKEFNMNDSCMASADLSSHQFRFVEMTGGATGKMTVQTVTATGTYMPYGVLENAPANGAIAQIVIEGICEIQAGAAFNAGTELTAQITTGYAVAAANGQYVRAIAREASAGIGHAVSCFLVHYYYGTRGQ